MPKKKAVKKVEDTTKEKKVSKIMTVSNLTDNTPEVIEPKTQEVEGKTWIKTTTKMRNTLVK